MRRMTKSIFLNLEKCNYNNRCIREIISKDGQETTKLEDIINEEIKYLL